MAIAVKFCDGWMRCQNSDFPMRFRDALLTNLVKTGNFSGRTSRRSYWKFFPVALLLPCGAVALAVFHEMPTLLTLVIWSATMLPLWGAGARRLQDTGEPGYQAVTPWGYGALSCLFLVWGGEALITLDHAFADETNPPDGPGGLGLVVFYGGGGLLFLLVALVLTIIFLMQISPAVGQTLVASSTKANKYGPPA